MDRVWYSNDVIRLRSFRYSRVDRLSISPLDRLDRRAVERGATSSVDLPTRQFYGEGGFMSTSGLRDPSSPLNWPWLTRVNRRFSYTYFSLTCEGKIKIKRKEKNRSRKKAFIEKTSSRWGDWSMRIFLIEFNLLPFEGEYRWNL